MKEAAGGGYGPCLALSSFEPPPRTVPQLSTSPETSENQDALKFPSEALRGVLANQDKPRGRLAELDAVLDQRIERVPPRGRFRSFFQEERQTRPGLPSGAGGRKGGTHGRLNEGNRGRGWSVNPHPAPSALADGGRRTEGRMSG